MGFKTDTIAAISTAMTNSGIGIGVSAEKMRFLLLTKFTKAKARSFCPNKKAIPFTMAISWTESRRLMKCWFF